MNAKETLEKIANALAIAKGDDKKEETVENVEATAPATEAEAPQAEDVKTEETTETVEDAKTEETSPEPSTEVKAEESAEEATEEKVEAAPEEVKEEEVKEDPRVAKMQEQIDELQKMLEAAVKSEETATEEAPEVKTQPLTHSPENKPANSHKKIGGHGGDVMSRVYKYLS
jgi:hypothetical protein